jgi:cytochrome c oxidase subunit 2
MDDYGLWLPKSASTFAHEIDSAINLVHILMLIMFVVWGVFFIYFLAKFREKSGQRVSYKGFPKVIVPVSMIAFVTVFDIYMLFGHDIPFWHKLKTDFPLADQSTVVRIVAQQFAWNIHYPGEDGVFGKTDPYLIDEQANPLGLDSTDSYARDDITTLGQLHIPVNKPVIIHLTTRDVIHSFSLPTMRVKQDAIPGMSIPLWFVPNRTGDWQIACAQLCGNSHFNMKGIFKVQTEDEFNSWLAEREPTLGEEGEEVW